MIKMENMCCNCKTSTYPCQEELCPNLNVKIYECDCCHDEIDTLYQFDGQELCLDCIEKLLLKIN